MSKFNTARQVRSHPTLALDIRVLIERKRKKLRKQGRSAKLAA